VGDCAILAEDEAPLRRALRALLAEAVRRMKAALAAC
jgi:hypothetical protein